jgi:hypothetical protein
MSLLEDYCEEEKDEIFEDLVKTLIRYRDELPDAVIDILEEYFLDLEVE